MRRKYPQRYEPGTVITLRVTSEQREELKSRAARAGLSLNRFIVSRLQQLQAQSTNSDENPYLARELSRQENGDGS